ncbi:magnesium transporter [Lachnoclostridium sp. An196]|uniref:magnesium transporter n=1 Tax=Lachnoclostridium sp. An196 TaxID=1965583 RepID=UPI000B36D9F3|nr:magnesium transporter [Lachnoclostridium sp. An196]OUP22557.1 magnesium transporter [Lachnoclostridium sp. An196]
MEQNDVSELQNYLDGHRFRELRSRLMKMNEADIAEFLEELDHNQKVLIFRMLPKELATDVFAFLEADDQEDIINGITDAEIQNIIEDLFVDDAVDMLEELPATVVKRVMRMATPETRTLINQFLQYPENSAGSIMTAEYIGLKKYMNVEQSFSYIRAHGVDKETIYTCFVMDGERHLEGVVTIRDLLMNPYETKIQDIMDINFIKAVTTDDQEEVMDLFNKYDLICLPVVDHENRLVGIVTVDDVVDVMEEEATEDFEKMAAMLPSDKPYLKTGIFELAKNRIVWLTVLMVSSMITGGILTYYEEAFAVLPLLVSFVPMLTGTGGNAGSQSSTMIIRCMAIGEVEPSDILKVIWKEVRVALVVGFLLAALNFLRLMIMYPGQIMICLTVVISLYITVIMAKSIGCTLPIIAKLLKLDPAIMAAPLISTIVDACSLIVYFRIACNLLNI